MKFANRTVGKLFASAKKKWQKILIFISLFCCWFYIYGNRGFTGKRIYQNGNHVYVSKRSLPRSSSSSNLRTDAHNSDETGFEIVDGDISYVRFLGDQRRQLIGDVLNHLNLKYGVEIGVQKGHFSKEILKKWKTCEKYLLVDPWTIQENYFDSANIDETGQERVMEIALQNVAEWDQKIELCRNYSVVCSTRYQDSEFDYVYIDARHDFKSVLEDLEAWYPKVRNGGIIAGHDYEDSVEAFQSSQNWNIQHDGSKEYSHQASRGAVNLFFALKGQHITWPDWHHTYKSWVVLKASKSKANNLFHFIDLSCQKRLHRKSRFLPLGNAEKVTDWLYRNKGFTSIVWTCELMYILFPDLIAQNEKLYHRRKSLMEDFVKFHILNKFGGIFVNFDVEPFSGVQRFYERALALERPFAFCANGLSNTKGTHLGMPCRRLSTLMIGSPSDCAQVIEMADIHRELLTSGTYDHRVQPGVPLSHVLNRSNLTVFQLQQPFQADPCDKLPYRKACIAKLRPSI